MELGWGGMLPPLKNVTPATKIIERHTKASRTVKAVFQYLWVSPHFRRK
jgi:hypothetical protein